MIVIGRLTLSPFAPPIKLQLDLAITNQRAPSRGRCEGLKGAREKRGREGRDRKGVEGVEGVGKGWPMGDRVVEGRWRKRMQEGEDKGDTVRKDEEIKDEERQGN